MKIKKEENESMTSRAKHMERSHRSYHQPKPFASFEQKAKVKTGKKARSASLANFVKSLLHRTTNK